MIFGNFLYYLCLLSNSDDALIGFLKGFDESKHYKGNYFALYFF